MTASGVQRQNMVESQVRPSDVTDRRITAAMQTIAREAFVEEAMRPLAYMDGALPVGTLAPGRALLPPRLLARLLQLASVEANDRVLLIGGLTGYAAAILSGMAKSVVALECDEALTNKARGLLAGLGIANVTCVTSDLVGGYAPKAPYDVIILEGAAEVIPEALTAQLAGGGRLVAIEAAPGTAGSAILITKSAHSAPRRQAFDAAAPVLPGFAMPKSFVF